MRRLAVGFVLLLVASCAGQANLSPREQAVELMARHTAVLTGVEALMSLPAVASDPDRVQALKRASHVATSAVVAYVDAAKACVRLADGTISGVGCNQSQAAALLPIAIQALQLLQAELAKTQRSP